MSIFEPAALQHVQAFAMSLAIGLLIGLERERNPAPKAGVRTFALVAMFGCLSGLLTERIGSGWLLAIGVLAVTAMMLVAVVIDPPDHGDPPTTSIVALLISYGLGVAVWFGYGALAIMAAIATTALLYFKTELHGITRSLTRRDLISILQFAALTFVILPVLPNENFGPFEAFNPHQIWLMVVLISGVSLAGYAALRIAGTEHGAPVIGFFGGLVSSTATTMVFSRHAHADGNLVRTAALVIVLANLMLILRLLLISTAVAPGVFVLLALALGPGLILGLAATLMGWRGLAAASSLPLPEFKNPTELRTALSFGVLYSAVLFLATWLEQVAGSRGLYAVALASGLTDVDAITLSSLRLYDQDKLAASQAVTSIALAALSNMIFKSALVMAIGGGALARRTLPGLAAAAVGIGIGLAIITA